MLTGKVVDRTFNAGLKVETATVDEREMQYLYKDGEDWVFMDTQSYEQLPVSSTVVGDASKYLLENQDRRPLRPTGRAAVRRAAGLGRADDHLHRPGLQGTARRWHQAATLETGAEDRRPAVHRVRHQGQGRRPRRVVPGPHQRLIIRVRRSKARKRALDVLYEADIRGTSPVDVLAATALRRTDQGQASLNEYVTELVEGVQAHREYIDELLGGYSMGWTSTGCRRRPGHLRLGTYELLWRDEVPDAVAISEAVTLAQELSTDESASFVNGLLGRLLVKPRLALDS